ncbi:MAG: hypothetical protein HQL87_06940 [Magnetococcales bacterium]|nr:hypothetical protein [Magnetococcales bacterium]
MSRKWMALAVFCLSLGVGGMQQVNGAPAAGGDADFQNEVRLSCEKYAKEDQIPPKEVKEYIALCIRDFSEAQPTDEFPPFESEEGIQNGAPPAGYQPLEKSQEMEKAHPIDPLPDTKVPVSAAPPVAKPPVAPAPPAHGQAPSKNPAP